LTTNSLQAVLFDLDGTLLDTAPDFVWVINKLLQLHGRPAKAEMEIRAQVSNGARAMVATAFEITPEHDDFSALHQQMLELYMTHLDVDTIPFPGISDLLIHLDEQKIPWGVVTNKPELYTVPVMTGLGLAQRCSSTICPDHVVNRKPHPEPLHLACEQIGCKPEQTVYVGDHLRDIEAGNAAGMLTISAAYGYLNPNEKAEDWQGDHIVNCATEIKPLLQSLYTNC